MARSQHAVVARNEPDVSLRGGGFDLALEFFNPP